MPFCKKALNHLLTGLSNEDDMNNKKWYQSPEMIVAFSALFISLVTAFIGIYSAFIDRAYARASVWPRLEIFRSYSDSNFSYGVANRGTGPALIQYAKVQYNLNYIEYWSDIAKLPNYTQSHLGNRILPPQNTIKPISYKGEESKAFLDMDKTLQIEVCYCSIYDECWVTNKSNNPQAIKNCTTDESEVFLQ